MVKGGLASFFEFVPVVDCTGSSVLLDLPKRAFDLHTDFYLLKGTIHDLGGYLWSFLESNDCDGIGCLLLKVAGADMNDAIGDDFSFP